jgi:hypothetical protein
MTFSRMTFRRMTLIVKDFRVTLSILPLCHNTECHYVKYFILFMLNVITLSVFMLNVMAPYKVQTP